MIGAVIIADAVLLGRVERKLTDAVTVNQVDAVVVGHCHASVTELKDVQHIVVVKAFLGGQPAELGQCVRCFLTEGGKREH